MNPITGPKITAVFRTAYKIRMPSLLSSSPFIGVSEAPEPRENAQVNARMSVSFRVLLSNMTSRNSQNWRACSRAGFSSPFSGIWPLYLSNSRTATFLTSAILLELEI